MRKSIHIRVADENNVSQAGFVLEFEDEDQLDVCLQSFVEAVCLVSNVTLTCEMITYDFKVNGIKIQKTKS